jgi:propionyl-CoA carboxylase alpha chain
MIRAIDDYEVAGVETTLGFCKFVLQHPAFVSGKFDTGFVKDHFKPEYLQTKVGNTEEETLAALLAAGIHSKATVAAPAQTTTTTQQSKWRERRYN